MVTMTFVPKAIGKNAVGRDLAFEAAPPWPGKETSRTRTRQRQRQGLSLQHLSIRELARQVRAGDLKATAVLRHVHQLATKYNGKLKSLVTWDEAAWAHAWSKDQQQNRSSHAPAELANQPLFGIPISIKDTFDVAEMVTTAGMPSRKSHMALTDATVVERFRRGGAAIVGHSNSAPYAALLEADSFYGRTRNPWDTKRSAGGSSGGGPAVALGIVHADIGSDLLGSVVIPAAFSHVVGFFSTPGSVPGEGHISLPAPRFLQKMLASVGSMTRSVDDATLIAQVMLDQPKLELNAEAVDLSKLKVAWFTDNGIAQADSARTEAVMLAQQHLARAGATVQEQRLPGAEVADQIAFTIIGSQMHGALKAAHKRDGATGEKADMSIAQWWEPLVVARQHRWGLVGAMVDLLKVRHQARRFLQEHDVVITPVTATAPPEEGKMAEAIDGLSFARLKNVLGLPAISLPAGFDDQGLPRSVLIMGSPHREEKLLAVARYLEHQPGFGYQAPPMSAK